MKRGMFFLSLILFASSALLGFCDVFITYMSGDCQIDRDGKGKWKNAIIDMELNENSVIKTGADGEIEIEVDGETVSIGKSRVMAMKELLNTIEEKKKLGWLKNISLYVKKVGEDKDISSRTAVAGVRGEKPGEEDGQWEVEWIEVSEEEEQDFQKGKAYFDNGEYVKAIPIFVDIVNGEEGFLREEASFYLGVSLFNTLRYREAQAYLSEALLDKRTYYYEMALVHYSISHYLLGNFEEAIKGLKIYTEDFTQGSLRPYAVFMLGKCYKEMGKREEALAYFSEVKEKYSDTDVYHDALVEIGEL